MRPHCGRRRERRRESVHGKGRSFLAGIHVQDHRQRLGLARTRIHRRLPALTWRDALARGCLFLHPAVVGYYLSDLLSGTYTNGLEHPGESCLNTINFGDMVVDVIVYLVLASAAAALALLVVTMRRGGPFGVGGALAVPAYVANRAFGARHAAQVLPANPEMEAVRTGIAWTACAVGAGVLLHAADRLRSHRF